MILVGIANKFGVFGASDICALCNKLVHGLGHRCRQEAVAVSGILLPEGLVGQGTRPTAAVRMLREPSSI